MAAFAVLRFINRKSLTYLNCLKGGICNEKADEHSKEGFYGTGGSCAGGSYHISSECLLPLVRTTCRARRAVKRIVAGLSCIALSTTMLTSLPAFADDYVDEYQYYSTLDPNGEEYQEWKSNLASSAVSVPQNRMLKSILKNNTLIANDYIEFNTATINYVFNADNKENLEYHCDWLAVDNQYLGNTSVCEFVNDDYGNTYAKIKFNTDVELQPNKQFVIHFRLNAADWSNWDTSNDYSMGTEQLLPNDKIIVFYNEQLISGVQP